MEKGGRGGGGGAGGVFEDVKRRLQGCIDDLLITLAHPLIGRTLGSEHRHHCPNLQC